MNINKLTREINSIHREIDLKMKNIEKICSKGCSHCCYQIIRVHGVEEFPITKYFHEKLDTNTQTIIKANLEKWFEYYNANTPNRMLEEQDIYNFSQKLGADKIPCPFLINNECSIYPVRPIACRAYSVKDNLELCVSNSMRDNDESATKIVFASLDKLHTLVGHTNLRLLQYAVREKILNQKISLKPVGITVLFNSRNYK